MDHVARAADVRLPDLRNTAGYLPVGTCDDCGAPLYSHHAAVICRPCYFLRRAAQAATGIWSPEFSIRFWSKVDKSAGPTGCWIWKGGRSKGYGHLQDPATGQKVKAHRVALLLSGTDVPADRLACHTCDNPRCVNPAHLYVGDRVDNARDFRQRGPSPLRARRIPPFDVLSGRPGDSELGSARGAAPERTADAV